MEREAHSCGTGLPEHIKPSAIDLAEQAWSSVPVLVSSLSCFILCSLPMWAVSVHFCVSSFLSTSLTCLEMFLLEDGLHSWPLCFVKLGVL